MENYDIKTLGEECLREKSVPVSRDDEETGVILDRMAEAIRTSKGIGIAAPQIGVNKRIIIFESEAGPVEALNPQITLQEGSSSMKEGCLSVPGCEADVKRAQKIVLKALDRNFKPAKFILEGLPARIVQHELDHLDGVLIVDYLSLIKRKVFERQWKKNLK
jgi:peptide deformylase